MNKTKLLDTGERIIPERVKNSDRLATVLLAQHLARYEYVAKVAAGARILDAGCGTGYGAAIMADNGATHVLGIDVSPEAIEYSRSRHHRENLSFMPADIEQTSSVGEFEIVTCFEVLEHVERPDVALRNLVSLLAPDRGHIYISGAVYPTMNVYKYHLRDYDEAGLRRTAIDAGLVIENELLQEARLSPKDVRRAMKSHASSFPLSRLARNPRAVVREVVRSHVWEGLHHRDLMLECVTKGKTAVE